jgi:hypothetical protein
MRLQRPARPRVARTLQHGCCGRPAQRQVPRRRALTQAVDRALHSRHLEVAHGRLVGHGQERLDIAGGAKAASAAGSLCGTARGAGSSRVCCAGLAACALLSNRRALPVPARLLSRRRALPVLAARSSSSLGGSPGNGGQGAPLHHWLLGLAWGRGKQREARGLRLLWLLRLVGLLRGRGLLWLLRGRGRGWALARRPWGAGGGRGRAG